MTMITPSYLGETIEYSSLHACRSTLEDPTKNVGFGTANCNTAAMKKRLRSTVVVFLIATAVVVAWEIWSPHDESAEPEYGGRPLSHWLEGYHGMRHGFEGEFQSTKKADDAIDDVIRQIGTNAIPALLRMLVATDSPLRKLKYYMDTHNIHHFEFDSPPALVRRVQAALAFRALGANASNAVPELIILFNRSRPEDSKELIAYALGGIGPPASNAVPSLLRVVTNANSMGMSAESFRALAEIHAQPEQVVPVIAKFLTDSSPYVRKMSIRNLQAFGADARLAVPALVESLKDQDADVRKCAGEALKAIDPAAAAKAGVK